MPASARIELPQFVVGRIVDEKTGVGIVGVPVHLGRVDRNGVIDAVTDKFGRFLFRNVPAGQYILATRDDEYLNEYYPDMPCGFFCDLYDSSAPALEITERPIIGLSMALVRGFSIGGRVVDARTDEPVAHAQVILRGRFTITYTDDAGAYRFTGLPPASGPYFVTVEAVEHESQEYDGFDCGPHGCFVGKTPLHIDNQDLSGIDFRLTLKKFVEGTVKDERGFAIAGAGVTAYGLFGSEVQAITDADGYYRLFLDDHPVFVGTDGGPEHIPKMHRDQPCCDLTRGEVVVREGNSAEVDFTVSRGASIQGRVVERASNAPVVGVEVEVKDGAGRRVGRGWSDEQGHWRVSSLRAGAYFAQAGGVESLLAQNHAGVSCTVRQACRPVGEPIRVAAGDAIFGVDFALDAGFFVNGRIVLGESLQPRPGLIELFAEEGRDSIDIEFARDNGKFSFGPVAPGGYRLLARSLDDAPERVFLSKVVGGDYCPRCNIDSGEIFRVQDRDLDLPIVVERGGTISGHIRTETGARLESVVVFLEFPLEGDEIVTRLAHAFSDDAGRYRLDNIPPGEYIVSMGEAGPYMSEVFDDLVCSPDCDRSLAILVRSNFDSVVADFQLARGFAISGRVLDPGSSSYHNRYWVELLSEAGATRIAFSRSFRFEGLQNGNYQITVNSETEGSTVYPGRSCVAAYTPDDAPGSCDFGIGDVIRIEGRDIDGIDITLDRNSRIASPRARYARSDVFLFSTRLAVYTEQGRRVNLDFWDGHVPPGQYYVYSETSPVYRDQDVHGNECAAECRPLEGEPITLKGDEILEPRFCLRKHTDLESVLARCAR